MAVKSSGSLSITTDIVGEFGGQAPHALSEYYRNGSLVPDAGANSAIPTSGAISFANFYGTVAELAATISSPATSVNLLSVIEAVYGTQSSAAVYRITNNATIGGTTSSPNNAAVTWGQFPSGSTITFVNNGYIRGIGGTAGTSGSGGAGGDAIYANYSNQTMNLENTQEISAGGGGGGKGGTGGTGGNGSYSSTTTNYTPYTYTYGSPAPVTYWSTRSDAGTNIVFWVGVFEASNYSDTATTTPISPVGITNYPTANLFQRGPLQASVPVPATPPTTDKYGNVISPGSPAYTRYQYSVRARYTSTSTIPTTGGAGGAGGNGGRGRGYNHDLSTGLGGSAGSPGSGPGAGTGGTGGNGGNGGVYGAAGITGATGATGNNGNVSNGSPGSPGSPGGAAGRYIVKGSNTVTITNTGTLTGGVG